MKFVKESALEDMNVTYYYAVVCVDAAGNVGAPGVTSSPVTNEAKGIPTISLDVPSNFVADGDLSEWTNSGIMPFVINPSTGGVWASVDDEADLNGTVYLAIDDDYIYFAADVIDDDYHFGEGNWWSLVANAYKNGFPLNGITLINTSSELEPRLIV